MDIYKYLKQLNPHMNEEDLIELEASIPVVQTPAQSLVNLKETILAESEILEDKHNYDLKNGHYVTENAGPFVFDSRVATRFNVLLVNTSNENLMATIRWVNNGGSEEVLKYRLRGTEKRRIRKRAPIGIIINSSAWETGYGEEGLHHVGLYSRIRENQTIFYARNSSPTYHICITYAVANNKVRYANKWVIGTARHTAIDGDFTSSDPIISLVSAKADPY